MHFENEIEHKILVTYVIAKVSANISPSCQRTQLRFSSKIYLV
nr:MAG TPA: hypothetical protein [Caudoviricetes sp.]